MYWPLLMYAQGVYLTGRCLIYCLCLLFFPVDINECLDESVCVGGQCLNTEGSYICFCTHPMVLDPNSNQCVVVPEVAGENILLFFCFIKESD